MKLMSIPESEVVVNLDKVDSIEKVTGEPTDKTRYGVQFSFGPNHSKFWWFHSPGRRDQVFDKLAQL